jgi:hypothetical protein
MLKSSGECVSAGSWCTPHSALTKLHGVAVALHKSSRDVEEVVRPVPLGKDGLIHVRVHDVLDTPDLQMLVPWR